MTQCPKCKYESGNSWDQCGTKCPMPASPVYDEQLEKKLMSGKLIESRQSAVDTVVNAINTVFVPQMGGKEIEVLETSKLEDDLGMDSLDKFEVGLEIEEKLEIEIPDDVIEAFNTVSDVVDYLMKEHG